MLAPLCDGREFVDITFSSKDALLAVDLQYDFLPDGPLHTPEGDQVIPVINELIEGAEKAHATIIASRDWHPANHISFQEQGGPWPPHCVQNTHGAAFHESVNYPKNVIIINKAFKQDLEAYSAFNGLTLDGHSLPEVLKEHGVERLIIGGLALDYCVKATALDAIKNGFEAVVVLDATRAINKEDGLETIQILKSFGVQLV